MLFKTYKKQILIGLGVVLLLVVVTRTDGTPAKQDAQQDNMIQTVSVLTKAELASSTAVIEANGTVETLESVDLSSEVSARVVRVNVSLGQQVYRGNTLVVFSGADLSANLAGAQADVESARANRKSTEAQVSAQEAAVAKVVVSSDNAIDAARAALQTAENNLRQSTSIGDTQVVRDAYADMIPVLQSAQDALASILVTVDNILGIDNTFSNDDIEDILSAENLQLLSTASQQYVVARTGKQAVAAALVGLNSSSQTTDIDAAVATVQIALEQYRELLLDVTDVLDATPPIGDISQTKLDALYTGIQTARSTIVGHITSVTNQSQTIDTAKNSFDSLQVAYDRAVQDLAATEKNAAADVAAARAQLDQLGASLELQDAQIKSAEARVAAIRASLAKTVITAPISGTIASLPATVGELMSPGKLAARIVNTEAYQVKTYIAAEEVGAIDVGNHATVAGKYTGTVTNISPSIDPATGKVEVIVVITSESPSLVSDQFVQVSITRSVDLDEVYTPIPLESVRLTSGGATVLVVNSDMTLEARTIEIGKVIGATIEADIREIDLPIVTSVRGLEAGMQVALSSN